MCYFVVSAMSKLMPADPRGGIRVIIYIRTTILGDPCADLQRAYSHLF